MSKVKLADVVEMSVGGGTPARDIAPFWNGPIPWATVKDFKDGVRHLSTVQESITKLGLNSSSSNLIPAGTPIICMRMGVGRVATAPMPVAINQDLRALFVGAAFDPEFVVWSLGGIRSQIENEAIGSTVKGISVDRLLSFEILDATLPEQSKIAEVLSTVDRAIAQTETLIAKQQRIKTGLMQDLLTRGIDEHGQLRAEATHAFKDSPLGRIPVEWQSATVGSELVGIDAGKSPDCPDRPAGAGEWGVLKVSAVQPDGFLPEENKVIVNPALVNPAYEIRDGDLLISRSNTFQLVGIVSLVASPPKNLMLCDKTLRLRFNSSRTNTEFMFWVLQQPQIRRQIELNATGTSGSMKNISQPAIRSLKVMLPSFEEQQRIVDRIRGIQAEVAICSQHAKKLRHVKTALMQDLLTGKVRVTPLLEQAEAVIA